MWVGVPLLPQNRRAVTRPQGSNPSGRAMETKICSKCKKEKPISEFGKNKAKKDGLQTECKECKSAYNKLHYQKNKETYLAKARESSKECEDYIREIKSSLKCSICGEDRWWVLDFHHENPDEKESCIATLAHNGSRKKMEEELKKCIVLCANCHRDIHFKNKNKD